VSYAAVVAVIAAALMAVLMQQPVPDAGAGDRPGARPPRPQPATADRSGTHSAALPG